MNERPILFSGPMVRAILEGRKTQTRRVVSWGNSTRNGGNRNIYDFTRAVVDRGFPSDDGVYRNAYLHVPYWHQDDADDGASDRVRCRFSAGDTLWVRETWRQAFTKTDYSEGIIYKADSARSLGMDEYSDRHTWRPSIFMPRNASRITLQITDVRVERVQAISREDEIAEGVADGEFFDKLWDSINGKKHPWESNCWVWVLSFVRVEGK